MEKKTPHTPLSIIQAQVAAGNFSITRTAVNSSRDMGLSRADVLSIIAGMTMRDFYKSMTTYADHTHWQDVYRPRTKAGDAYVKFMFDGAALVVSFKEL